MHYHQNLQFFILRTLATTVNKKKNCTYSRDQILQQRWGVGDGI